MIAVLASGIAVGAIYAAVAIAYNLMYAGSKVLSFNTGHIVMASCLASAWLVSSLGISPILGLPVACATGAILGYLTYEIGIRRLIDDNGRHLWILSTLGLATIIQNLASLLWGTEPRPFPRLFAQARDSGIYDQRFWLPVVALLVTICLIWFFLHRTIRGKVFIAISNDAIAALARGIRVNQMRAVSFVLAGALGGITGFAAGQLTFAYFAVGMTFTLNGFMALAVGGLGSNLGAVAGGLIVGLSGSLSGYLFGSQYEQSAMVLLLLIVLFIKPEGLFGAEQARLV